MTARRLVAGIDLAFVHDGAALVVCERMGDGASQWLRVVYLDFRVPKPGQPFVPSEICAEWCDLLVRMGCRDVTADVFYLETLREETNRRGLVLHNAPAGTVRTDAFIYLRHLTRNPVAPSSSVDAMAGLVYDPLRQPAPGRIAPPGLPARRLALPEGATDLREQLGTIRQTMAPGGNISITAERAKGAGHADLAFGLVAAAWLDRKLRGPIGMPVASTTAGLARWAAP